MIKQNIFLFLRNARKNKIPFLINILGLSTGLASVFLIMLWVNDEIKVDNFHAKGDQIYQILNNFHSNENDIETWQTSPVPLASTLMQDFPEVELASFADYTFFPKTKIKHGEIRIDCANVFTDENFFDVFSYKLKQGNKKQLFANKNSIVISETVAIKLYGSLDTILGRLLEFEELERTMMVSGVFEDPPTNSTHQFDVLTHLDIMIEVDPPSAKWNSTSGETYAILKKGTDIDKFNEKIKNLRGQKDATMASNTLYAQQYSKKYLQGRYENGKSVGGRIDYIKYFSLLALFILLIACINFMNLSTAQASKKMKEIGVKKTMGASKNSLILQFLGDSVLMSILAMILAIGLVFLLLPWFNQLTTKPLTLTTDPNLIISLIATGLVVGIFSGSYPAFYLSSFNPVTVLKGNRSTSIKEQRIRKGLVIFQFALSVIFILGVLVVDRQLQYTQNKNMGYSRDQVISFQRPYYFDRIETFLSELRNIPGVDFASNMNRSILDGKNDQGPLTWKGNKSEEGTIFKSPQVGFDLIETLGIELKEGRTFSKEFNDDENRIVINESAQKLMALDNSIGEKLSNPHVAFEIIGVVKDFHYGSLHNQVTPLFFRLMNGGKNIIVKLNEKVFTTTIPQIEKLYSKFHPEESFEFTFLDEDNQQLYNAEKKVSILSKFFAGLAILISCLGLYGLTSFIAERRRKEIGIRKVLGQSIKNISLMLSSEFIKLVFTAIIIATPIAYYLTHHWLQNFAYRIPLKFWYFLGSSGLVMLIAILTVSFQTIKAASANPIKSLRTE